MLHNFSRSITFILVTVSSNIAVVKLLINIIYVSSSFMKLYERDVDFVNNITIALSNEEMTK